MRNHASILRGALAAGLVAVLAAWFLPQALAAGTAVQYTTSSMADLPPGVATIARMFGHPMKPTITTTTTSRSRLRVDNGDTTTIVQCDLKRVITADNKAKSYYVQSFDDLIKRYQNAMNTAAAPSPAPSGNIKGSGTFTISTSDKPDSQTQTILGITAHHTVQTTTMQEQGTGDCHNTTMTFSRDIWYTNNTAPFSCPNAAGNFLKPNANMMGQNNPCMQKFQIAATGHPSFDRVPLKEVDTVGGTGGQANGGGLTIHVDTTAYKTIPYDPSFFDVPAGYTQATPPTQ